MDAEHYEIKNFWVSKISSREWRTNTMEEMLINDISGKYIVSKIYSNPNTWNFFSILFISSGF